MTAAVKERPPRSHHPVRVEAFDPTFDQIHAVFHRAPQCLVFGSETRFHRRKELSRLSIGGVLSRQRHGRHEGALDRLGVRVDFETSIFTLVRRHG